MIDCWTGIDFLVFLQGIRESLPQFFTDFFLFVSSSFFFKIVPLILFPLIFWLIDKKKGEFCIMNSLIVVVANNTLKSIIKQPRPYVINPEIEPVIKEGSYSTPSSHASTCTTTYGSLAILARRKWIKVLLIAFIAIILFSRLWLGVHTPFDIIFGLSLAAVVIVCNYYIIKKSYENEEYYYSFGIGYIVFSAIIVIVLFCMMDNSITYALRAGMLMGFVVGRMIEHKYVAYEAPKIPVKNLIIIGVLGLLIFGATMDIFNLFGNPTISFIGGIIASMWCVVIYPYIIKNKMPGTFFTR